MWAFIVAGVVFVGTLAACGMILLGDAMSPTGTGGMSPWPTFIAGSVLAVLIAASHWLPHFGW
jgi:hypothetical protein